VTAKFAGAPFDPEADAVIPLAEGDSEYVYHDPRIVYAVNVAMIARRPLLVTGSPGSGKSTLADDVARRLGWALAKTTITSRTRLDDLVARFDAVKRLSHAQAKKIDERDGAYLVPGVFWWAFAPDSARAAISAPKDRRINPDGDRLGTVVLLDEIDKAEPDLPNDLRCVAKVSFAFRRETHAPRCSIDQSYTESLFNDAKPLRRSWRRQIERSGGTGHAPEFRQKNKKLEICRCLRFRIH